MEDIIDVLFGNAISAGISTVLGGLGAGFLSKVIISTIKHFINGKKIAKDMLDYVDDKDYIKKVTGEAKVNLEDINITEEFK